jgi:hypothetical protein
MKILIIAALSIILATCFKPIHAGEISIESFQATRIADDDMYQTGRWLGIQASYGEDDYVFISQEKLTPIPLWGMGNITMTGLGVGTKHKLTDRLSIFGQIGYYFVKHENEGRHRTDSAYSSGAEGISYYFNTRYSALSNSYVHFDEYMIDYDDTIAGSIGLDYTKPISKNMNIGFSVSYRSMKLVELLRVMKDEWDYSGTGQCWEQKIARNYSSINYGIKVNYVF